MTADDSAVLALLARWLPRQRWFAAKGGGPFRFRLAGRLRWEPDAGQGGAAVEVRLVTATSQDGTVATYQVPLAVRTAAADEYEHALVGVVHRDGVQNWVYDGPHDPAFPRAYLHLISARSQTGPPGEAGSDGLWACGVRQPGAPEPDGSQPSQVLQGEQSNTSVIVGADGDHPLILKIFRVLHGGQNPDVIVQSALASAGCLRVPQPLGWVEGAWTAPDGSAVTGHLAIASTFLTGGFDAWRVACVTVEAGGQFDHEARALGMATAQVHAMLARTLPTSPATPQTAMDLADALTGRVEWATRVAPILGPLTPAAATVIARVREVTDLPNLQRIHGDYHLGQVLHTPERGWVLLDFEGEPMRPLAERSEPDLTLRDVAGMLRSFDYAARHKTLGLPEDDPRVAAAEQWISACRNAFLDGYAEISGDDPRDHGTLLDALELDKALYEVVYETRNRPTWVPIPLHAVRRLLAVTPEPAGPPA